MKQVAIAVITHWHEPGSIRKTGNSIGGIIVKGVKIPAAIAINLITDENGEVTFPITEKGEYTLTDSHARSFQAKVSVSRA